MGLTADQWLGRARRDVLNSSCSGIDTLAGLATVNGDHRSIIRPLQSDDPGGPRTVGLRPRSWESPNFLVYSCIQDFTGLHFLHKRRFFVHDSCMGVAQSQARSQLQTV